MTDIPHLALPLTLNPDGSLATVEQGEIDDVATCVQVLVSTVAGGRIEIPEYGVPELPWTDLDLSQLSDAIGEWEPRATVDLDRLDAVDGDDLVAEIVARVSVA